MQDATEEIIAQEDGWQAVLINLMITSYLAVLSMDSLSSGAMDRCSKSTTDEELGQKRMSHNGCDKIYLSLNIV